MVSLVWANELGLYEKKGYDFYLTQEGLRVSQERQNMTPEEVRDIIRKGMQERTHLKVLSEDQCEWNDRGVQQNPVETGSLPMQEIFGNLGARVQPPIEEGPPTAEPKVAFEVSTLVFPT
jgi:hypothetical protein